MTSFTPEGTRIYTTENEGLCTSLAALEKAAEEETLLEGIALRCEPDLSLYFEPGGIPAILPKEEVLLPEDGCSVRDIAVITRVGKPCVFTVTDVRRSPTPQLVLSRRRAQEKCLREYLNLLEDGDLLPAKVTHLEPFGAFCDIGCGISSLLSIDCISVSRISHPSDRFFIGQELLCAVKCRDEHLLGGRGRICLTHKELLGTWQENADRFQAGQTVMGVVRSVESYGIFIELAPNLAGLAEWRGDVKAGDGCSVYIKSILPQKRKIKLVIIDLFRARPPKSPEYFIREGNIRAFQYGS